MLHLQFLAQCPCTRHSHRFQKLYFEIDDRGQTFIERAIRYGSKYQENKNSAQVSLFGETSEVQFEEPHIPDCEPWGIMEKLAKEKEVIGMYISGHPLDDFRIEKSEKEEEKEE